MGQFTVQIQVHRLKHKQQTMQTKVQLASVHC